MKKKLAIIGSVAMKHHFPDFPRIPQDTDVIISQKDFTPIYVEGMNSSSIERWQPGANHQSFIIKWENIPTPVEYLFSDSVRSLELILDQMCDESDYVPVDVLYSLKKAHIHFPIKFQKHIHDLMFLREKLRQKKSITLEQDLGSESDLLEMFPALTELHFNETEKRRGKLKTPKMNQTTEDFFGKSKKYVKSYYTHDNIHLAICHSAAPIYIMILKGKSEVETDITKWSTLTIEEKIWCVLEEVYVIALERKILPQMFENIPLEYDEKSAFDWALMRVCTTLCDGFFRDFAVRAYDQIQKQYNPDYVKTFFKNIYKYEKIEDSEN